MILDFEVFETTLQALCGIEVGGFVILNSCLKASKFSYCKLYLLIFVCTIVNFVGLFHDKYICLKLGQILVCSSQQGKLIKVHIIVEHSDLVGQ